MLSHSGREGDFEENGRGPGYKESFAPRFAKDSDKVGRIITKIAKPVKHIP
jgi:hypothetical protein